MRIADKVVVVTGAASGIGKALAVAFAAEGAKVVICADRYKAGAQATAITIGGVAWKADVGDERQIHAMINGVELEHGPIDLFCSNAGIYVGGGPEVANDAWKRIWDINLMSHVWAARHLAPRMVARGGGYFLNTASAAGLLTQVESAPYAVTKHAAVAFSEWLAITYGDQGVGVSVLCPQAVRTPATAAGAGVAEVDGMLEPEDVAKACVEAIEGETFLVTPHLEVREYIKRKAGDHDRWIRGMRRLRQRMAEPAATI